MAIALPIRDRDTCAREIIGQSRAIQEVQSLIERVAPSDASVLIYGETGTGKELVAHEIHRLSHRARQPFVVIDCTSLPSELVETELFGHEKGAFTGAIERRDGKFGQAHRGTVFLDEVGDLPLQSQVKLLGVLQRQQFSRIGGNSTVKIDVRVVAATNRPLEEMVRAGLFREELYYRLNVIQIGMPPLRDRIEDIPMLVHHFLSQHSATGLHRFTDRAMDLLLSAYWPGNIRELENAVESLVVQSKGYVIDADDFPADFLRLSHIRCASNAADAWDNPLFEYTSRFLTGGIKHYKLLDLVARFERDHIIKALEDYGWHISRASASLGINRTTLHERMKRLKIKRPGRSDS